jgi:hypothetical protein
MSIADATKKLLGIKKQALGNAEIAAALKAGGLVMNSAEPINTIGSILGRRFAQVGDVVRVGRGQWGLKEWYPNRSFRTTSRAENGVAAAGIPPSEAAPSESEDQIGAPS